MRLGSGEVHQPILRRVVGMSTEHSSPSACLCRQEPLQARSLHIVGSAGLHKWSSLMTRRSISVDSRRLPSNITKGNVLITNVTSVETRLVVDLLVIEIVG